MRIPIFGTGVSSGQKQVTVRKTVGMYWERRGETERSPMVAVPFPDVQETGLTMTGDPTDSIRLVAKNNASTQDLIVVSGKTVYTAAPLGPAQTPIGDLTGATTGLPRVAPGPGETFLICDGINAWYWSGTTYTQLDQGFFTCTWMGGYFIAAKENDSGRFYVSTDGTTWTDMATAEAAPDSIKALVATRNELFILGSETTEVWAHTGDSDFPFARINGATTNVGCDNQRTAVLVAGTLYFVARAEGGMPFVARMNGYTPERVSTGDIDRLLLESFSVASARDALGFVWNGHPMYMLSDSSGLRTIYFDAATGLWGHVTDGTRHRIVMGVEFQGRIFGTSGIAGASADRKIYQWPPVTGGAGALHALPKRQIITDHVVSPDGERFTVDSLRLDMATNIGSSEKSVSLKVSRDGGLSWGSQQTVGLGTSTGPQKKVEFRRLGRSRSFTFDLSFPTDVPLTVHSASLNASD